MEFVPAALEQQGVSRTDLPSAAMVQVEPEPNLRLYNGGQMLDKWGVVARRFRSHQENKN